MQPLWRILVASTALALASTAAFAQNVPPAPASSQPSGELIGPPQLSNFSLQGKVTQEAAPRPETPAQQRQPSTRPAQPSAPIERTTAAAARKAPAPRPEQRPAEIAARQPVRATVRTTASAPGGPESLQAFAGPRHPARAASGPVFGRFTAGEIPASSSGPQPNLDAQHGEWTALLWVLAALAAAAAVGWYFLWQRPRAKLLPAGLSRFDLSPVDPMPRPSPAPPPPPPASSAPRPKSNGIVSTRLRPWIDLQVSPERAVVDGERVVIEFTASIFNSGSAPARDLLVEAAMFNAGPMQDSQIGAFFQNPVAKGERIAVLEPMQRLAVRSAVILARSQVVPVEIEGQRLLVPLIGFNALYRWGGSAGQTSTSYLVGKTTATSDKLAPFRLDAAPRIFRRLAAREYELRVRQ